MLPMQAKGAKYENLAPLDDDDSFMLSPTKAKTTLDLLATSSSTVSTAITTVSMNLISDNAASTVPSKAKDVSKRGRNRDKRPSVSPMKIRGTSKKREKEALKSSKKRGEKSSKRSTADVSPSPKTKKKSLSPFRSGSGGNKRRTSVSPHTSSSKNHSSSRSLKSRKSSKERKNLKERSLSRRGSRNGGSSRRLKLEDDVLSGELVLEDDNEIDGITKKHGSSRSLKTDMDRISRHLEESESTLIQLSLSGSARRLTMEDSVHGTTRNLRMSDSSKKGGSSRKLKSGEDSELNKSTSNRGRRTNKLSGSSSKGMSARKLDASEAKLERRRSRSLSINPQHSELHSSKRGRNKKLSSSSSKGTSARKLEDASAKPDPKLERRRSRSLSIIKTADGSTSNHHGEGNDSKRGRRTKLSGSSSKGMNARKLEEAAAEPSKETKKEHRRSRSLSLKPGETSDTNNGETKNDSKRGKRSKMGGSGRAGSSRKLEEPSSPVYQRSRSLSLKPRVASTDAKNVEENDSKRGKSNDSKRGKSNDSKRGKSNDSKRGKRSKMGGSSKGGSARKLDLNPPSGEFQEPKQEGSTRSRSLSVPPRRCRKEKKDATNAKTKRSTSKGERVSRKDRIKQSRKRTSSVEPRLLDSRIEKDSGRKERSNSCSTRHTTGNMRPRGNSVESKRSSIRRLGSALGRAESKRGRSTSQSTRNTIGSSRRGNSVESRRRAGNQKLERKASRSMTPLRGSTSNAISQSEPGGSARKSLTSRILGSSSQRDHSLRRNGTSTSEVVPKQKLRDHSPRRASGSGLPNLTSFNYSSMLGESQTSVSMSSDMDVLPQSPKPLERQSTATGAAKKAYKMLKMSVLGRSKSDNNNTKPADDQDLLLAV